MSCGRHVAAAAAARLAAAAAANLFQCGLGDFCCRASATAIFTARGGVERGRRPSTPASLGFLRQSPQPPGPCPDRTFAPPLLRSSAL